MEQVIQTPEQQHYLSKLLGYEYTIAYKPGKDNLVADALSRQSEPATAQFLGFSTPQFVFLDNLIKENQSDPELATLHQQVINDPHSYSDLTIKDGLLFKNGKLLLSSTSPLRHSILHEFHSTPVGGHGGIYKTLKKISSNFVWPGLKADVESFVKSCEVCQQTKYVTSSPAGLLQPIPIPTKVWHDLAMDFITHLPSYKGNTTILVVVDRVSKAAHFGMLPSTYTAYSVAELFSTMICQLYGFPNSIISDRDPIFTSQFWQSLFKLNGTSLRMSSSYHPQLMDKPKSSTVAYNNTCVALYMTVRVDGAATCTGQSGVITPPFTPLQAQLLTKWSMVDLLQRYRNTFWDLPI